MLVLLEGCEGSGKELVDGRSLTCEFPTQREREREKARAQEPSFVRAAESALLEDKNILVTVGRVNVNK